MSSVLSLSLPLSLSLSLSLSSSNLSACCLPVSCSSCECSVHSLCNTWNHSASASMPPISATSVYHKPQRSSSLTFLLSDNPLQPLHGLRPNWTGREGLGGRRGGGWECGEGGRQLLLTAYAHTVSFLHHSSNSCNPSARPPPPPAWKRRRGNCIGTHSGQNLPHPSLLSFLSPKNLLRAKWSTSVQTKLVLE